LLSRGNQPDAIDWARTKVWALGLNGIYLNLAGRENHGIVQKGQESRALLNRVRAGLLALRDPANGLAPIETVIATNVSGPNASLAPDLITGYSPGYRSSWQTGVGGLSNAIFEDNEDAWIADHCINAADVPGVLFTTRKVQPANPQIKDLPVSLLALFGIEPEPGMTGHSIYDNRQTR
jgi:predicted AlkP superfamily phosphohydrolase/phosphomutase